MTNANKIKEIIRNFKKVDFSLKDDLITFLKEHENDMFDKSIDYHLQASRELLVKLDNYKIKCVERKTEYDIYNDMQIAIDTGKSHYSIARMFNISNSLFAYYIKQEILTNKKGDK